MKILNITYNTENGGLEQCFVDYAKVLSENGHEIFCVIPSCAIFKEELKKITHKIFFSNIIKSNFLSIIFKLYIKILVKKIRPDLVIYHNSRNISSIKKAIGNKLPLIAVNHGTNPKKMLSADYIFVVNNKIKEELLKLKFPEKKIFKIDNFVFL